MNLYQPNQYSFASKIELENLQKLRQKVAFKNILNLGCTVYTCSFLTLSSDTCAERILKKKKKSEIWWRDFGICNRIVIIFM